MFMQKLGHKHYKLFLRDNKLLTGAIQRAATHRHLGTRSQKPITILLICLKKLLFYGIYHFPCEYS